ncbi:hypothetical protein ACIBEJ_02780 [Nonomuraea sp. NPDC050790]|uniref:hypothetical protein n=1 Tax=Nonomuraea sp. NPDC050790 TaxID=3364371 RepID=UPI0037967E30
MTLFELQAWLGHRSPDTTQHYAKITPETLAQACEDAGYFERNVRTIEVLIDRDAVESGAAAADEPWQYYDLGHGFCDYTFFEQCPHRMACAMDVIELRQSPVARQHNGMTDLRWDEVREFFDPDLMGALPDIFVPDATVEDWQRVLDLVRARGWLWEYSQGDTVLPLPNAAEVLARPPEAEMVSLRVWPAPGVLAIFRLMSETEIDFDVDLRELQGQAGVDTLCDFLRAIGSELGKPVLMTPEGESQDSVLGFDPVVSKVVLLGDPAPN